VLVGLGVLDMRNKLEVARLANDHGRHHEALSFFKEAFNETNDLSEQISIAGAIVSTIVLGVCEGDYPAPGTAEYHECQRYLRIQLDAYDQADPIIQSEFAVFEDVEHLKRILQEMELGMVIPRTSDKLTRFKTCECALDRDSDF
jgi:hypothetical protein